MNMNPLQNPVTTEEVVAIRLLLKLRKLGYALAIETENHGLLVATHLGNDRDVMAALEAAGEDEALDIVQAVRNHYMWNRDWPKMETATLLGAIIQYQRQGEEMAWRIR
jgi:hypothetical protein